MNTLVGIIIIFFTIYFCKRSIIYPPFPDNTMQLGDGITVLGWRLLIGVRGCNPLFRSKE
jgi:hypothetical protein